MAMKPDKEEVEEVQEMIRASSMPEELQQLLKHTHNFGKSSRLQKMASPQRRKHGRSDAKAEKKEDEELVQDEDKADLEVQLHFDVQPPVIKGGTMRKYQVQALNWLIALHEDSTLNGILADEMGLGKTLETISLFGYLKHYRNIKTPSIISVPLTTLSNWCREFARWCPSVNVFKFHGSQDERPILKEKFDAGGYDIMLTSYETVNIEISYLSKKKFYYMVIDEGHRIKNPESLYSKNVRRLDTKHRLLLSGTPIQNNLKELWGLLNYLAPQYFVNCQSFEDWFKIENVTDSGQIIKQLHMILRPFILRRLKKTVEKDIPDKIETCIYTGLTKVQKQIYSSALARDIALLNGQGQRNSLLNLVMQLRKCCNHPYLFHGVEPGPPYEEGEHIVESCGKLVLLDKLLRKLKERGDRVLLFSQMTRMLDIIEDYIIMRGYKYQRLDGKTKPLERLDLMDEFNAEGSEDFIFLLSTRAGGLGINLQTANVVILYDSDWNPQMDLQAIDRAHRIGQTKTVQVYRLITDGTVEEHMIERAMKKLFLDAVVIQHGRLAQQHKKAKYEELCKMVRFGAAQIFKSDDSSITDEDIDAILQKGEERTKANHDKLKKNCDFNLLEFTYDDEPKHMNDFEEGKQAAKHIPKSSPQFINLPTRNRGTIDYSESAYYKRLIDGSAPKPTGPKIFKPKVRPDYQFFNNERLVELQKKDFDAQKKFKELKDTHRQLKEQQKRDEQIESRRKLFKKDAIPTENTDTETKEKPNENDKNSDKDTDGDGDGDVQMEDQNVSGKRKHDAVDDDLVMTTNSSSSSSSSNSASSSSSSSSSEPPKKKQKLVEKTTEELKQDAGWLTQEDLDEMEKLSKEGFADWNYRDISSYINSSANFGRKNIKEISRAVDGKTPAEVKQYHKVFWERHEELERDEQWMKRIETGEADLKRLQKYKRTLNRILNIDDPLHNLDIPNTYSAKDPKFTMKEDRFILCEIQRLGWGEWDLLKTSIRKHPDFRFDWYVKSRTSKELEQRCKMTLRNFEGPTKKKTKPAPKTNGTTKSKVESKKRKANSSPTVAGSEKS